MPLLDLPLSVVLLATIDAALKINREILRAAARSPRIPGLSALGGGWDSAVPKCKQGHSEVFFERCGVSHWRLLIKECSPDSSEWVSAIYGGSP